MSILKHRGPKRIHQLWESFNTSMEINPQRLISREMMSLGYQQFKTRSRQIENSGLNSKTTQQQLRDFSSFSNKKCINVNYVFLIETIALSG